MSGTILALETSSAVASAAVVDARGDPLGQSRPAESAWQARRLLDCVDEAFAAAGSSLRDVETVVCGLGPGTFTGLRIGVATARALAQAADLRLAGVPSLEALAVGLAAGEAGASASTFVPLIDGRRGEVFAAVYRRVERAGADAASAPAEERSTSPATPAGSAEPAGRPDWPRLQPLVALTVVGLDDLAGFLAPWPGALIGGDGALLHAGRLPPAVVTERAVAGPSALLAARTLLGGSPRVTWGFGATLPIYGREPDATPRATGPGATIPGASGPPEATPPAAAPTAATRRSRP